MEMVSSRSPVLFLLSTIFILTTQVVARPDFLYYFCIHDKGGNSAGNSSYEANFGDLLLSLSAVTENKIDRGVSHHAYGQNSDQVYAIGFCRGDVNPHACRGFLNDAAFLLTERCPQQKEAIGWYDECMLRYSNRSTRGAEKTSQKFFMWNLNNMSGNYDLRTPLERRRSGAAAGGGLDLMIAAGNAIPSLYALAQCTPDLSEQECNHCLLGAFESIPQCCDGKEGGRVERPSCNIRFENYPFYNLTTAALRRTLMSTNTNKREARDRSLIFVIINKFVVAVASVVLIISMGIYVSVKGHGKNYATMNEITSTELDLGYEAKKNGRGYGTAAYKRYTQIRKKLSTMIFYSSCKKKDGSFVPPLNQENEVQEAISQQTQPIPDGSLESDDAALMCSSSTSKLEADQREVNRLRDKISSIEEEVSSLKRQQTQLQQEMEAKQRQQEQQIEFLLSQLQLRRDPPT